MKVIFLDVDGVLNYERCPWMWDGQNKRVYKQEEGKMGGMYGMDPERVDMVKRIVRECDAKIVLSSTWRIWDDWKVCAQQSGFFAVDFIGVTPRMPIPGGAEACERGHEIQAWLWKNALAKCATPTSCPYPTRGMCAGHEVTNFAIIDDDSDMLPAHKENGHFFQTSWKTGLTDGITENIIAFLGKA